MLRLISRFIFVFSTLLVSSVVLLAQPATTIPDSLKKYKPVEYPSKFSAALNEVYTRVGDWEGRMDVYYQPGAATPTPLVINIHGGGWKNGVKENQGGFTPFFKAGIAIANIEYRMTDYATAPAAIEDARCALIFLIQNANRFNIDINKIVVMGGSAGGHLALMTGLLANNRIFDKNCKSGKDIKVAAIIDKWGITDVWAWAYNDYGPSVRKSKSPTDWLGPKKNDEAFAKMVSPIWYVNKKAPPILIIHGDADSTVPYVQSQELLEKLKSFGVRSELITVTGGGHGKFSKEKNTELSKNIIDFILSLEVFKN